MWRMRSGQADPGGTSPDYREPADGTGPDELAVVITGGTRGIGAGLARAFLQSGDRVMICGRTTPGELPAAGGRIAVFRQADVRDPGQASALIRAAADEFGRIDLLISNAGGAPEVAASDASPRFLQKIIELNLTAPLLVAQSANAVMQAQQDGGAIIMIGSVSGTRPSPGTAAYGAAKAGLHHLVTSLAIEWAPKVRLNCVAPGMVATEAAADYYGEVSGSAAILATVPLGGSRPPLTSPPPACSSPPRRLRTSADRLWSCTAAASRPHSRSRAVAPDRPAV